MFYIYIKNIKSKAAERNTYLGSHVTRMSVTPRQLILLKQLPFSKVPFHLMF